MIEITADWSFGLLVMVDDVPHDLPKSLPRASEGEVWAGDGVVILHLYEWGTANCSIRAESPPDTIGKRRSQASFTVRSGTVVFYGTGDEPDGPRFSIDPGKYRLTLLTSELEESDDGTWWYVDIDMYFELLESLT